MRWPFWMIAAGMSVAGAGWLMTTSDSRAEAALTSKDIDRGYGPDDYAGSIAEADRDVARLRTRVDAAPDEWLRRELLGASLLDRFSLTGSHEDLLEAQAMLAEADRLAPDPSGPNLAAAHLAMTTHDPAAVAEALDMFDRTADRRTRIDRAAAAGLRGDIAFQRGELGTAGDLYGTAAGLFDDTGAAFRRANLALWSGEPTRARGTIEGALRGERLAPRPFAQSALLMANIAYAAGDLDRAREWIDAAGERYSGWWLVEAYDAQQMAAEGDWDEGIGRLAALAERTSQPEVMDVLAGMLIHRDRSDDAQLWTARAEAAWRERLSQSRSAYRLHAAEHFLDFGDPEMALRLAAEEIALRRAGEVVEVYASALIANGRAGEALAELDRAGDAGWHSVSLHLARAEALTELGRTDEAEQAEQAALALSPLALDPRRKLLRFGHY